MSYITDSFDDKVVGLLKNGGVGLIPTDTIYGLSCRALDQVAVEKIHKLKDRDSTKPFIVLISDIKMLDLLSISQNQAELVIKYWPCPLTIVFTAPSSPDWLQLGLKTLAVRLPDHPELLKLINEIGPIISTSVNLEGQEPVHSIVKARTLFGDKLDFYVDTGELNSLPSTIAVAKNGGLEVIRQGAVKI